MTWIYEFNDYINSINVSSFGIVLNVFMKMSKDCGMLHYFTRAHWLILSFCLLLMIVDIMAFVSLVSFMRRR